MSINTHHNLQAGGFEQGNLVVRAQLVEAWDLFAEVDDLDDAGGWELTDSFP